MKKIYLLFISFTIVSLFSFRQQADFDLKSSIERGKEVYQINCMSCHQELGEGVENAFPPLAKSDYMMADKDRSILEIIKGVSGEIKVNGVTYNGEMSAIDLTDKEVSDVLNYVRNSFGNKSEAVTPENVKLIRNKK